MSKPVAYIQYAPSEPMHEHCLAAWQGFLFDGYDVRLFEQLTEGSFATGPRASVFQPCAVVPPINSNIPVVASIECTRLLFEKKKKALPAPLNIPAELLSFAGRSVDSTTLGDFLDNYPLPAFVKPADTCKLWAGGVVRRRNDARLFFSEYPLETPVLTSPEVEFVSEYRVFVNHKREIVDMKCYLGNPFIVPDEQVILDMIATYKSAPRCYSLDVAVLSYETVIVECNDFFALGTYGMDPLAYSRMLAQRWHEIVANTTK